MFLKLEDGSLVNVQLIDRVELKHHGQGKSATLWAAGIVIAADSHIAYRFFTEAIESRGLLVTLPAEMPKPADA